MDTNLVRSSDETSTDAASSVKTPLYQQIKKHLFDRIQSGEFPAGEKIPTENELQEEYKVSRATVRHALEELELEEVIGRRPGAGTIVLHQKVKPELMKLSGFSGLMMSRGMKPDKKILKVEVADFPARAKACMADQGSTKSWYIRRLLLADDRPIGLQDLYIPARFTFSPNELYGMTSFYGLMAEKHHIKPSYGEESLSASPAKKADAALLNIKEGDALLDIWRTTYDETECVFEVCHILYIADRYEYQVKLYP